MSYSRLNLVKGDKFKAEHVKHLEDGIVNASNTANSGGVNLYEQAKLLLSRFEQQHMINLQKDTTKVDIIMFAGQSNSCGRATLTDATTPKDIFVRVDKNIGFTFQTKTDGTCVNSVTEIIEPITVNGSTGYGYIPAFINAYNAVTGRKVCACFKSNGGTSLHTWFPYELNADGIETTTVPAYYTAMKTAINSSKTYLSQNGYTLGDIVLVWCQGENDAAYLGQASSYTTAYGEKMTTDELKIGYYKKGFARIVEKLKEDVGLTTAFNIRIGHSGSKVMRNEVIIEAQNQLCKENPNCVMVSTVFAGAKYFVEEDGTTRDLMKTDGSHYLPEGYLRAGMEAGVNAGIYQNSNKLIKPILLEYNTLYKIATNNDNDAIEYERPVDKYIYDPCRVDFNFMKQFEKTE